MEYSFARSFVCLFVIVFLLAYYGKRPFADVPNRLWKPLLVRSISGTISFTTLSIGLMTMPLAIFTVIFNCTPFFTAILAYFYLKESISHCEVVAMIGSFIGVMFIAIATPDEGGIQD